MKKIFCVVLLIVISKSPQLFAQDVSGSKDHALITRYPGSVIGYYEEQTYAPYNIALGPQTGYKQIKEWKKAEGKLTRIYYTVKGQTTLTEIYRNYKNALNKGGFKILAEGIDDKRNTSQAIGGRTFLTTFYESNPLPVEKDIHLLQGSSTSGGSCYLAAERKQQGSEVTITIGGSQYSENEKVVMVDILEKTSMVNDLIATNAAEMLRSIQSSGKVSLYGIYFDTDKTVVKPESEPELKEIAKLLQSNPQLKVYVVGHTDMEGSYQYNLQLSEKRAAAVKDILVKNYSIPGERLSAAGVGSLAPATTNKNAEGRKLNRRVELVEF